MNIYFSGLGGVGIGPLAQIAHGAGHTVIGSDIRESPLTEKLRASGVLVNIGQDGTFLQSVNQTTPIDWFVHTSALPNDHPELVLAKQLGIRTGKRDAFLAEFIQLHNLELIAVAGTHGKTTTTGMMVWALQQLGVAVSYSVGSTLSFGDSGHYEPGSRYFVYECDEFDKNFLHFEPTLSLITSVDYDHPDTYPTADDYTQAFRQYIQQSHQTIAWQTDIQYLWPHSSEPSNELDAVPANVHVLQNDSVLPLHLLGAHTRRNATLVHMALTTLGYGTNEEITRALEAFPGTDRRFQKLGDNLYSDYGHHPTEIQATLQAAREITDTVVLVYQPHQNVRQHQIRDQYTDAVFEAASEVYWLPTYLSREDPNLLILTPEELTKGLSHSTVHTAELDDSLWNAIQAHRQAGHLVLCMGAGTIDSWAREQVARI